MKREKNQQVLRITAAQFRVFQTAPGYWPAAGAPCGDSRRPWRSDIFDCGGVYRK